MSSQPAQSEMTINDLSNSDLKKLASLFRDVPSQHSIKYLTHKSTVQRAIKALPAQLHATSTPPAHALCSTHTGLNVALTHKIWHCMHTELGTVLGKSVFPLLVAQKLTSAQELAIRYLEPVSEMFDREYSVAGITPTGRAPITAGKKWSYQANQCPACMLSRIGSDESVLRALYACMIGYFPTYKLASRRIKHENLSPTALDNPKSKRVRFVRYWLKECKHGDALLFSAAELGIVMKKATKALEHERKAAKEGEWSLAGESQQPPRVPNPFADSKLGPEPRAETLNPQSPAEPLGFNVPAQSRAQDKYMPTVESESESDDEHVSICPSDSISRAPSPLSSRPSQHPSAPVPRVPGQYATRPNTPGPLRPQAGRASRGEPGPGKDGSEGPSGDPERHEGRKEGGGNASRAGTEWGDMY